MIYLSKVEEVQLIASDGMSTADKQQVQLSVCLNYQSDSKTDRQKNVVFTCS